MKKEFQSFSLREALMLAAEEFNVDEDKLRYEINTEKTKYFGHKQKEIHITAWPIDENNEKDLSAFIKQLVELMGLELEFSVTRGRGFVSINFSGPDYKLLLYKNGNLLNAIQYLLNRLFSDSVGKKIFCESENFRKNKERELSRMAHQYAKTIRKAGRPMSLKEMNPFERRVVHMIINKYADLESMSEGNGFLKTLTIRKK